MKNTWNRTKHNYAYNLNLILPRREIYAIGHSHIVLLKHGHVNEQYK